MNTQSDCCQACFSLEVQQWLNRANTKHKPLYPCSPARRWWSDEAVAIIAKYRHLNVVATLAFGLVPLNAVAATCTELEASLTAMGNQLYASQHVNVLYCLSLYPNGYVCGSDITFTIEKQTLNGVEQRRNAYRYVGPASTGSVVSLWNSGWQNCDDQYTITLSGGTITEPGQDLNFTATVTNKSDGQPPTNPVDVKISLKVDPTSGGHDHGDSARPRGGIAGTKCDTDSTCWTGTTDGGGVVTFNCNPTDVSGTHTITAMCDKCSNSDAKQIEVKVLGLEPIPASQFYSFVGATVSHADNHYLTPDAAAVLWRIAVSYQAEQQFKLLDPVTGLPQIDPLTGFPVAPTVLHVNDASLIWGGKFDINGSWKGDHQEHRRGTVVDIRANNLSTAIPDANFEDFQSLADDFGADAYLEEPPDINRRHFHLRLLNRKE